MRVTYLPDAEGVRLAFAIGRPVGNAVTRNRLRRRLRAAFVELDPPPGTYLVSASPSATSRSFAALQQELRSAVADVTA